MDLFTIHIVLTEIRFKPMYRLLHHNPEDTLTVLRKWYTPKYELGLKEGKPYSPELPVRPGLEHDCPDSQTFQQQANPPDNDNSISSQDESTANLVSSSTRKEFIRDITITTARLTSSRFRNMRRWTYDIFANTANLGTFYIPTIIG